MKTYDPMVELFGWGDAVAAIRSAFAKGDMAGSLIIFEAADFEAAKAWHAGDPSQKAGLFSHSEVRPWKATANFCEAKL